MSASAKKKLRKEQESLQLTEKQKQEQKEAKKLKIYTSIFAVVMVAVLLVGIISWAGQGVKKSGLIQKYTTGLKINGEKISSAELNYFFIDAVRGQYSEWYKSFGDSTVDVMKIYGLDLTKPLNSQPYNTTGEMTWADYFANLALGDATTVYVMCNAAEKDGFKLSAEEIAEIDESLKTTEEFAKLVGASNLNSYLESYYGPGSNRDTYRQYLIDSALARAYSGSHSDSLSYTEEQIREYDKENYDKFSTFDFTSVYLPATDFYTGGTEVDGKTTYSDEEKAAGLKAAKEAAEAILNATPSTLAELNAEIAKLAPYKDEEDPKTASENTDKSYDKVTAVIRDWMCEEGRKANDLAVIPATTTGEDGKESEPTGYYVVIYNGREDFLTNMISVRHILAEFEGGTEKDGETVYTEAEKLEAKKKIDEIYKEWLDGEKTEESFGKLADEKTDDDGSKGKGGLYENVFDGAMVEGFNEWCFDESRQPGDVEIVETEFGYHLMYFVKTQDQNYHDYMIQETLRADDMEAWYEELRNATEVDSQSTKHLNLDYIAVTN